MKPGALAILGGLFLASLVWHWVGVFLVAGCIIVGVGALTKGGER